MLAENADLRKEVLVLRHRLIEFHQQNEANIEQAERELQIYRQRLQDKQILEDRLTARIASLEHCISVLLQRPNQRLAGFKEDDDLSVRIANGVSLKQSAFGALDKLCLSPEAATAGSGNERSNGNSNDHESPSSKHHISSLYRGIYALWKLRERKRLAEITASAIARERARVSLHRAFCTWRASAAIASASAQHTRDLQEMERLHHHHHHQQQQQQQQRGRDQGSASSSLSNEAYCEALRLLHGDLSVISEAASALLHTSIRTIAHAAPAKLARKDGASTSTSTVADADASSSVSSAGEGEGVSSLMNILQVMAASWSSQSLSQPSPSPSSSSSSSFDERDSRPVAELLKRVRLVGARTNEQTRQTFEAVSTVLQSLEALIDRLKSAHVRVLEETERYTRDTLSLHQSLVQERGRDMAELRTVREQHEELQQAGALGLRVLTSARDIIRKELERGPQAMMTSAASMANGTSAQSSSTSTPVGSHQTWSILKSVSQLLDPESSVHLRPLAELLRKQPTECARASARSISHRPSLNPSSSFSSSSSSSPPSSPGRGPEGYVVVDVDTANDNKHLRPRHQENYSEEDYATATKAASESAASTKLYISVTQASGARRRVSSSLAPDPERERDVTTSDSAKMGADQQGMANGAAGLPKSASASSVQVLGRGPRRTTSTGYPSSFREEASPVVASYSASSTTSTATFTQHKRATRVSAMETGGSSKLTDSPSVAQSGDITKPKYGSSTPPSSLSPRSPHVSPSTSSSTTTSSPISASSSTSASTSASTATSRPRAAPSLPSSIPTLPRQTDASSFSSSFLSKASLTSPSTPRAAPVLSNINSSPSSRSSSRPMSRLSTPSRASHQTLPSPSASSTTGRRYGQLALPSPVSSSPSRAPALVDDSDNSSTAEHLTHPLSSSSTSALTSTSTFAPAYSLSNSFSPGMQSAIFQVHPDSSSSSNSSSSSSSSYGSGSNSPGSSRAGSTRVPRSLHFSSATAAAPRTPLPSPASSVTARSSELTRPAPSPPPAPAAPAAAAASLTVPPSTPSSASTANASAIASISAHASSMLYSPSSRRKLPSSSFPSPRASETDDVSMMQRMRVRLDEYPTFEMPADAQTKAPAHPPTALLVPPPPLPMPSNETSVGLADGAGLDATTASTKVVNSDASRQLAHVSSFDASPPSLEDQRVYYPDDRLGLDEDLGGNEGGEGGDVDVDALSSMLERHDNLSSL